jgi:glutamyl-tRNA reductase
MTVGTGVITSVSIAHSHADLDTIETACSMPEESVVESLLAHTTVVEAFSLQTCNRFEAYVVTESPDKGHDALQSVVSGVQSDAVRELGHEESLRHLMRVSCGLESLVLGEDQILGQVREAYLTTRAEGLGPVLEEALTKSIHVGERARTETAIDEGVVSLGSAAARLAGHEMDLGDASALVIGAGEMGTLAARSLATAVDQLDIANRTIPHAEHVVETLEIDGEAIGLDGLSDALAETDVVVSATGSDMPIVDRSMLSGAGETLLIDIAQPRDIAPKVDSLPGVVVRDLASLKSITDETTAQRRAAAENVESMIDQELDRLLAQYKRKRADEAISAMYAGAENVKQQELSTALSKLEANGDITDEQREVVESLADALVGQLLSAPTKSLRDAAERDDWSTINTALQLFDPQFDGLSSRDRMGEVSEDRENPASVLEQLSDD